MWKLLFDWYLSHLVCMGSLTVAMPDGSVHVYGPGGDDAPKVSITLTGPDTLRRLVINPHLAAGETYMDQSLTIDGDDLHGFLELVLRNIAAGHDGTLSRMQQLSLIHI